MQRGASIATFGFVLAALALCAPHQAQAAVITQTIDTTGSGRTGIGCAICKFGGGFNQFDPSLGTLDAVTLNIAGAITYRVSFAIDPLQCVDGENQIGTPCSADFNFSTGYNFNAPGFPVTYQDDPPFFAIENWSGSTSISNLAPQSSGPLGISYSGNPSSLGGYVGNGEIEVDGQIGEDSDVCNDFGLTPTCTDNLNLAVTLTYAYTPVPEAGTLPLFGAGLFGLGSVAALRRRKKKAA